MSSFKNNFCYSTIFPILDRCVKLEKERKLASSTDVHPKICHEFFKLRNSNLLAASKILLAFFCVLFVVKTFWKMDLGSDNFRNELENKCASEREIIKGYTGKKLWVSWDEREYKV